MPTIPNKVTMAATAPEVLNAIRNNATQNYRDFVPVATPDAESVREIGAVIMQMPGLQNEFLSALMNRIAFTVLRSKMYDNPLRMFKKGDVLLGESVEEIFVNLAKPFTFDPVTAENEVFKRQIPDVKTAFFTLNYQKFYKQTISNEQLKMAFLSWDGLENLIAGVTNAMYTAASYDEFQITKYMIARKILNGQLYPMEITTGANATAADKVKIIKGLSNKFTFENDSYNLAGVYNHSTRDEQYILLNSNFDAEMNVDVLATAFNMDKAEFMGHRVLVDAFGDLDTARLEELIGDDPGYVEITETEKTALNAIPAILIDENYIVIYNNLDKFTEIYNGQGLYWNYFYHVWRTFGVSPFANAAVFVPGEPGVTSVTVSPATANVAKGQNLTLSAEVVTTNFAPKSVDWSITTTGIATGTTIDNSGYLHVAADEPKTTITIQAKSTFNETKTGTATITIS